jgi:hypothetical protein
MPLSAPPLPLQEHVRPTSCFVGSNRLPGASFASAPLQWRKFGGNPPQRLGSGARRGPLGCWVQGPSLWAASDLLPLIPADYLIFAMYASNCFNTVHAYCYGRQQLYESAEYDCSVASPGIKPLT